MGEYLRKRYNDTLSQLYLPNEIDVRTTDFARAKMTALAALAAMYPPLPEQKWHAELNWQPIPYYTKDIMNDDVNMPLKIIIKLFFLLFIKRKTENVIDSF